MFEAARGLLEISAPSVAFGDFFYEKWVLPTSVLTVDCFVSSTADAGFLAVSFFAGDLDLEVGAAVYTIV